MKPLSLCVIFLLAAICSNSINGQDHIDQQEIDSTVWEPFIEAFNSGDHKAFSQVHSENVVRVVRDQNRIFGFDEYFPQEKLDRPLLREEDRRDLELRFIQRISNGEEAFDVGYYRSRKVNPEDGSITAYYGHFHVLMRKVNGQWKIFLDADANHDVTEDMFMSASPLTTRDE